MATGEGRTGSVGCTAGAWQAFELSPAPASAPVRSSGTGWGNSVEKFTFWCGFSPPAPHYISVAGTGFSHLNFSDKLLKLLCLFFSGGWGLRCGWVSSPDPVVPFGDFSMRMRWSPGGSCFGRWLSAGCCFLPRWWRFLAWWPAEAGRRQGCGVLGFARRRWPLPPG